MYSHTAHYYGNKTRTHEEDDARDKSPDFYVIAGSKRKRKTEDTGQAQNDCFQFRPNCSSFR